MRLPGALRRRWSSLPLRIKVPLVALLPAIPVLILWLLIGWALMRPQSGTPSPATRVRESDAILARLSASIADLRVAAYISADDRAHAELTKSIANDLSLLGNNIPAGEGRTALDSLAGAISREQSSLTAEDLSFPTARLVEADAYRQIAASVGALRSERATWLARATADSQRRGRTVVWVFLGLTLAAVGGGLWAASSLMRGITRRLELVVRAADGVAAGQSVKLAPLGGDEIGRLGDRLHDILLLLRDRERELSLQNRELAVVNEELEAFSYSVSHDLRSPLRAIAGFSQVVEEEAGSVLNPEARDALLRVRLATARMNVLIDELLKLSRVARAPLSHRDVDISGLAHEVADRLRLADPARTVSISIAPDICAEGDPALLMVALENLLSNAWKFTGRTPEASIWVTAVSDVQEVAVTVKDNGAGFDMAHAKMLFGPFQRLHTQREFTGTGIGLATVQRITRRHGGRVLADAAVGQGAAFTMVLPRVEVGSV
jgi:signal transduction histidine kinase